MIHNPILPGFNPDPSICRSGDDYYIATSSFEWFPGVPIHHSKDLVNWHLLTHALDDTRLLDLRGIPASGGVWAPALSHHNGTFYLCYTVVSQLESVTKDTPNFLTTAASIEGPWSDPIYVNSSGFDPSLYHDSDGRKYWLNMVWDHRPGKHPFYGIQMQELDLDTGKLTGKSEIIFKGSNLQLTEGPHLYKRKGYYYLLTAEGGTEYGHAASLARSKNIWGPYEIHPENPILTSAGNPELRLQRSGHASLVETPNGEWYMPHLCGRPLPGTQRCNLGRETALQKVEWREDDWLYLSTGGNSPKVEVPSPDLPAHPWPELESRLPFDSLHYVTPRIPSDRVIRSQDILRLKGAQSLESCFEQAILARRLTTHQATVTTALKFAPNSFQQVAGLAAYYNNYLFHYLYLSVDETLGRCLQIHSCNDGKSTFPIGETPISVPEDGLIYLRMDFDNADLQFFWSTDGDQFDRIGNTLDASILSDENGSHWGFTGTFIALSCQDLTGANLEAEFEFLELK